MSASSRMANATLPGGFNCSEAGLAAVTSEVSPSRNPAQGNCPRRNRSGRRESSPRSLGYEPGEPPLLHSPIGLDKKVKRDSRALPLSYPSVVEGDGIEPSATSSQTITLLYRPNPAVSLFDG
jgi:hypothetical protein